jgi:hypothetical protein
MTTIGSPLRRCACPAVVAFVLVVGVVSVVSGQNDPHLGTWELNLARSSFSPGPPPKSQTLTISAAGPHWTALVQGVDASGGRINPEMGNLAITFDGKDHPTPNMDYDASAWKRISPSKYEVARKRAGKTVLTTTNVVSADGMTMTITTDGVNADGQPVHNVQAYDRRR